MKEILSRSGQRLIGRLYELYTGDCPPERPCLPAEVADYRRLADGQPKPAVNQAVPPPLARRSIWRFLGQVVSYAEAVARWKLAGSPVTPPEELAKREQACRACPRWDAARDGCRVCGCGTQEGGSLKEKRGMASETCPLDKW